MDRKRATSLWILFILVALLAACSQSPSFSGTDEPLSGTLWGVQANSPGTIITIVSSSITQSGAILQGFCNATVAPGIINDSNSSLTLMLNTTTNFTGTQVDSSLTGAMATFNGKTLSHGKFNNTPLIVQGVFGNAYKINDTPTSGLSYIEIPTSPVFNMSAGFTISFWVNASTSGVNYDGPAIYKTTTADRSWRTQFTSGNKLTFQVCPDGSGVGCITATSTATVVNSSFVYVTEQWNGSHVNVYVNGILNGSSALSSTPYFGNLANLTIGKSVSQGAGNATYDELRIWNASLNQSEILAEMNSPNPVRGAGLVASYSWELNNITAGGVLNTTADTSYLVNGSRANEGAYYFDGISSYMRVSQTAYPAVNITGNLTLIGWGKFADISGGSSKRIIHRRNGNFGYILYKVNSQYNCAIGNGSTIATLSDTITYPIGEWHQGICVYDSSTGNLSAGSDGVLHISTTILNGIADPNVDLFIGSSDSSPSNVFNGSMGRLRIYPRVITNDELRFLYNASYVNATAWQFDYAWFNGTTPYVNGTTTGSFTNATRVNVNNITNIYPGQTNLTLQCIAKNTTQGVTSAAVNSSGFNISVLTVGTKAYTYDCSQYNVSSTVRIKYQFASLSQQNVEPLCQNASNSTSIWRIQNNGTAVATSLTARFNESLPTGITMACGNSSNVSQAVSLTTVQQNISAGFPVNPGANESAYCWVSLNNPTTGKIGKNFFQFS